MPQINFVKSKYKTIEINQGTKLMESLIKAQMPVASSCLGDGVCGKCKIKIIHGPNNLSIPSPLEVKLAKDHRLQANERISCQAQVLDDITIDADYW